MLKIAFYKFQFLHINLKQNTGFAIIYATITINDAIRANQNYNEFISLKT